MRLDVDSDADRATVNSRIDRFRLHQDDMAEAKLLKSLVYRVAEVVFGLRFIELAFLLFDELVEAIEVHTRNVGVLGDKGRHLFQDFFLGGGVHLWTFLGESAGSQEGDGQRGGGEELCEFHGVVARCVYVDSTTGRSLKDKIGKVDPLSLLERNDKWFLGGGRGAIYAPPFPKSLHATGFWDECFLADIRMTRLFTVLFTDLADRPIRIRTEVQSWRPDRLILEHRSADRTIRETRLVTEDHEWVSVLELLEGEAIHAFVWSLPELREKGHGAPWQSLTDCRVLEDAICFDFATTWPSELEPDRTGVEEERLEDNGPEMLPPLTLHLELSANLPRLSHTVNFAQRHEDAPLWETSLLPQKLKAGRLPGDFKLYVGPPPMEGLVHLLQQYELLADRPLVVWARARIGESGGNQRALGVEVVAESEGAWRAYFASVPQFNSSDPYLTAAYWYRWYGLRLNTVDIPNLPIACRADTCQVSGAQVAKTTFSPFITEGVGFFRNFVTYSAQAHLREVAWMHSPRLGLGILENLAKCQRMDGSFPGHNYSCRPARDFYHADFATGARRIEQLQGVDVRVVACEALREYANWLIRERSTEDGILVIDQNETGQEYMSRYQEASQDADQWGGIRVNGVDSTSYFVALCDLLDTWQPEKRSHFYPDEKHGWSALAWDYLGRIGRSVKTHGAPIFRDILNLPGSEYSSSRPATGFYPFAVNLPWRIGGQYLEFRFSWVAETTYQWLLNPNEFWLPKGFPATALSDLTFSADAEWKDKRLNCPWNGRSWPMVNSHLVDAIANVARHLDSSRPTIPGEWELGTKAGEALMKAITLMFHDGDPTRPNSYEHYDPFTGTPSLYRGYDDYMHSWIVDLIMRHAVGVKPGEDDVDPLPLGVEWIECTDIPHPRGRMNVRIERDQVVEVSIKS